MDMSALTIRRCSCAEILENPAWPEVQKAYADEVRYPDLPADLDYLMYLRLETFGVLKIVGGFDAEGRLVAVCNYLVFQLPHFAGKSLASSESLWVDPAHRGAFSLRFIREVERCAKQDGCYGIYFGTKEGTAAERFFSRVATPMNRVFWKKL